MNRFRLRLSIIVMVATVVSGLLLEAQSSSTGAVRGQISVVGGYLAGARVVISSTGDANYTANSTTDANGIFSIAGVPVGTIQIRVYDSQTHLLKTVSATLDSAGQVINVAIHVP